MEARLTEIGKAGKILGQCQKTWFFRLILRAKKGLRSFVLSVIIGSMSPTQAEFKKALVSLEKALSLTEDDVSRDASIQRFEFCVELA